MSTTPTTAPPVREAACPLDDLQAEDAERVALLARERLKAALRMNDEELNKAFMDAARSVLPQKGSTSASNKPLGDPSKCRAAKVRTIVNALHMAIMAIVLVTLGYLVYRRGRARWPYWVLQGLSALGSILTVVSLWHVLRLSAKMAWYGSGIDARALLILTGVVAVLTSTLSGIKDFEKSWMVVPVLVLLAAAIISKMVFLGRTLSRPNDSTNLFIALVSAIDRMLPAKRFRQARRAMDQLSVQ